MIGRITKRSVEAFATAKLAIVYDLCKSIAENFSVPRIKSCFRGRDGVGQLDKLLHGQALGAQLEHLRVGESRRVEVERAERVADGLAALAEGCLHHCAEEAPVAAELRARVAREAQHAAGHLGRGCELAGRHIEEILTVIPCLEQHTEYASDSPSRGGAYPLGHLLLQHAGDYGNALAVVERLEEDLRGYVVGIVADERELTGKKSGEVHLQEVALHHVESGETAVEVTHRLGVDLDGLHLTAGVEEESGEDAHAGAHLEDGDVAPSPCGFGKGRPGDCRRDAGGNRRVVEKVLAEGLFRSYFFHRFIFLAIFAGTAPLLTIMETVFSRKYGSET